ncbi:MAG: hypothetical protein A49_31060 [Methyloceanibacter sp.]|nr:MAG: hypothetical protein A49_31060 [Methyloceanibacter sp.]
MGTLNHIEAIEARLEEIREKTAALEKEHAELLTALNVLNRLSPTGKIATSPKTTGSGPPRPDGLPTIFEMVELVLKDAELSGESGLTARQIVDTIGARYWPGVADSQIQPSLYRFAKAKRLKKRGAKFQRVTKDETPSAESEVVE